MLEVYTVALRSGAQANARDKFKLQPPEPSRSLQLPALVQLLPAASVHPSSVTTQYANKAPLSLNVLSDITFNCWAVLRVSSEFSFSLVFQSFDRVFSFLRAPGPAE